MEGIRRTNDQDSALLGRLTTLQMAISDYVTACRFFLYACPASVDHRTGYDQETVLWALEKACVSSIEMCEACSDVLRRTGLLPEKEAAAIRCQWCVQMFMRLHSHQRAPRLLAAAVPPAAIKPLLAMQTSEFLRFLRACVASITHR